MNLNQEINKLKSQVVHSPEKTRKVFFFLIYNDFLIFCLKKDYFRFKNIFK